MSLRATSLSICWCSLSCSSPSVCLICLSAYWWENPRGLFYNSECSLTCFPERYSIATLTFAGFRMFWMDKDVNLINKRKCYGTALIVSDRCVYSWTCCYSRYIFQDWTAISSTWNMRSVRESFRIRLLKKQQQECKIFNNICQGGVFGDSDPGLVLLFLF